MIQIRKSTYRSKPGFTISGLSPKGHHVKIFTETRSSAEHIRDKVKRGEEIELGDFSV